ncbi:hypothetical protein ACLOJK_038883 [Asimina triloba]
MINEFGTALPIGRWFSRHAVNVVPLLTCYRYDVRLWLPWEWRIGLEKGGVDSEVEEAGSPVMMIVDRLSSEWDATTAVAIGDHDWRRWRQCYRLWRRMDGRMVPSKKMIGNAFAGVGAWIRVIGCVHKNQVMMMVPSRLDMVVYRG